MSQSKAPEWLRPMWEQKTSETAARVADAVTHLSTAGASVTLTAICRTVQSLYNVSMSANTILRNPKAYDVYLRARGRETGRCTRDQDLRTLVKAVSGAEKENVQAKILRLRRRSKDSLIARSSGSNRTGDSKPVSRMRYAMNCLKPFSANDRKR